MFFVGSNARDNLFFTDGVCSPAHAAASRQGRHHQVSFSNYPASSTTNVAGSTTTMFTSSPDSLATNGAADWNYNMVKYTAATGAAASGTGNRFSLTFAFDGYWDSAHN
jgi:hypothetical protein